MSSTLTRPEFRPARADDGERELRQRLAGLRRRSRLVVACRGGGWLVACLLLTLVGVGLLDFRLHLPALVRAAVLVGMLTGACVILYRLLIRPLAEPTDDLSLALRVEDRYPLLNDSLASTVQFLDRSGGEPPEGESPGMRREAIRRALGKAAGLDFARVVDGRGTRPAVLAALVAVGLAVPAALGWPALAATALARLANPFASIDWPKKTRIELESVVGRIGRGREYRLSGLIRGVVPREVTVEITHDGFPVQRKPLAVNAEDGFTLHLRPEEVQRNFRLRVIANDAVTPEFPVEVLSLPRLVSLDGKASPRLRIDLPGYTDLPSPQVLPPGMGNLDVVAGSVVTLRAAADRPLRRAWISCQPELAGTLQAAALAPLGLADPLAATGALSLSKGIHERVPARLGPDGRRFEVHFRPAVHGMYVVGFEDENGLENSQTFEMRLRLDPPPVVRLERPSPSKDVLNVLASAALPLSAVVEDQPFAVRSVWLEYRTQPDEAPRRVTLYDADAGVARAAASWAGAAAVGARWPRLRLPRVDFERVVALDRLRHADGAPLKAGDTVTLQVRADDFDDVSVGKPPGESHQVVVRIVARDAFEAEVNREQARVQKELVALRDRQRDALAKTRAVEARLRQGGKVTPDREAAEAEAEAHRARQDAESERATAEKTEPGADRDKHEAAAAELQAKAKRLEKRAALLRKEAAELGEGEARQQQVRERMGGEQQGLRAEVERLRETLRQNGMANTSAAERMKGVARELQRLAERELEPIEPKLANVRKMSELQDEKAWQERRASLEDRARQGELAARDGEARAEKLEAQARRAAQEPRQGDARAAARQAEVARRLREEADEQRKRAAEQRAEAERDRRDAADRPDPARVRRELAEARRGQEEIEKSLSSLLQDLEPWSSSQEVAGEASRLAQEQKELRARLEELAEKGLDGKGLAGKSRDSLTEAERAELDNAQDAQRRLTERTAQLLEQMKRQAEKRAEKDAETAEELKKAADRALANNLVGNMKSAQDKIGNNRLNEARAEQGEAAAELEKLQRDLKDSREAQLDRLARKLRQAEERVQELLDEQEKLQRKVRDAAKIKDPQKRDEELQRLARRQRDLQKKTAEALEGLSRSGNERTRQALAQAQEEMKEAFKRLSRGKPDDEKQEEALDRLDEAVRELEQARQKAEEELGREQIARVADVIRRLRERQEAQVAEGKRLQEAALQRKGWARGLVVSLGNLADNQKGLAEETAAVAKKDLTAAPVFARLVERSARAMARAGDRADAMRQEPPDLAALPDGSLGRLQAEALRRLDQLLASLKEAQDGPRPLSRNGQGGGGDPPGGAGGDDSLPPAAQLRLIRTLQQEVNERTEAFRKGHPDLGKLGPAEKAELEEIRRDQKEVADLVAGLMSPGGDEPPGRDGPPEDKEEAEGEKP